MYDNLILLTGEASFLLTDCDCACPHTLFPIQHDFYHADRYIVDTNNYQIPLKNNYHLLFNPQMPIGPSVLNQEALQRYQTFATKQKLLYDIDYKLAEQHFIIPADATTTHHSQSAEQLTAWLHVTNACNLDCPYCYIRKSSENLSEEMGKLAIEKLIETAQKDAFRKIKLKFAGGEALLNFKLIKNLFEYAQKLTQKNNIELTAVVLSNGTVLNNDIIDWITANQIKLMLSVDGIGQLHDNQRPTKKGQATFEILEKYLIEDLLPKHIKPNISITVTKQNAHGIADIVKWAIQHELTFNINFYRENLLSQSQAFLKLEETTIISGIKAAYQAIEDNLPSYSLLNGLLDKIQTFAHTHTCGVGKNYVVITHRGEIAQCQMHLNETVGTVQQSNHIIPLIAQGKIQNLSVDEKEGCKTCEFRYRCTGGCPAETYRVTGRWDIKSPHCNIYKTLYPEALRLEGLRLLKQHGLN